MKLSKFWTGLAVLVVVLNKGAFGAALEEYRAVEDPNYQYRLISTIEGEGYCVYVLDMTSQKWRSEGEVNRTLWHHWLTIVKPDKADRNKALLWINGGNNGGSAPRRADSMLVEIALQTQTAAVELEMVPNQPLIFADEDRSRYEDAIIAYSFDKYLKTKDEAWPVLEPMVRSAVRAMDTVHRHLGEDKYGGLDINEFVVSGASKRGWTSWLTGAADGRVIAIIPLVIDVLNMDEQMEHHYQSYGFYFRAIKDYVDMKVFDYFDTPQGQALIKIVDPYEHLNKLKMPKYLINSTGDQFFLPDAARFYFNDLPGEKYLRYVPNTDHSLRGGDVQASLLAFYKSILDGAPRPQFRWQVRDDGIIVVRTEDKPRQVNLWQADNPRSRDFRLETIGRAWESRPLKEQSKGIYVARPGAPGQGWRAFFVELIYESGGAIPFKFTTEVSVISKKDNIYP